MPPVSATCSASVWGRRLAAVLLAVSSTAATPGVWAGREIDLPRPSATPVVAAVPPAEGDFDPAYDLVLLAMLAAVASMTQRRRAAA